MSSESPSSSLATLLSLLEDAPDAASVPAPIVAALAEVGPSLRREIAQLRPSHAVRDRLTNVLAPARREWLRRSWNNWRDAPTNTTKLEAGLSTLSDYLSGFHRAGTVTERLNALADDIRAEASNITARELARELFGARGFHGAKSDYYAPENSDLGYVLDTQRGLPISLACVYILVGTRLGLDVRGLNMPGHFVAVARDYAVPHDERSPQIGEPVIIDCFDGGTEIDEERMRELQPESGPRLSLADLLQLEADAESILIRTVRNLAIAFREADRTEDVNAMVDLLQPYLPAPRPVPGEDVDASARFGVGDTVEHRRYGYRGLIVSLDETCEADALWYRSNEVQPSREQPWYHVLVHETGSVTYAAQSSLQPDESDEPIQHPLVDRFFFEPSPGNYVRNETPWPPAEG